MRIRARRPTEPGADRGYQDVTRDYHVILTPAQLDDWIERLHAASVVSLDTETTGLDPMQAQLVGIAFSIEAHQGAYLPLAHCYAGAPLQLPADMVLDKLKPWLHRCVQAQAGAESKIR